jgi:hypothetical protein
MLPGTTKEVNRPKPKISEITPVLFKYHRYLDLDDLAKATTSEPKQILFLHL